MRFCYDTITQKEGFKLNIKQYIKNIFIKQDCLIYSLALWKFSQLETNIPLNPTKITQNLYKIFY